MLMLGPARPGLPGVRGASAEVMEPRPETGPAPTLPLSRDKLAVLDTEWRRKTVIQLVGISIFQTWTEPFLKQSLQFYLYIINCFLIDPLSAHPNETQNLLLLLKQRQSAYCVR